MRVEMSFVSEDYTIPEAWKVLAILPVFMYGLVGVKLAIFHPLFRVRSRDFFSVRSDVEPGVEPVR
jgi:hypothetical protein